jgi:hypothetical protein
MPPQESVWGLRLRGGRWFCLRWLIFGDCTPQAESKVDRYSRNTEDTELAPRTQRTAIRMQFLGVLCVSSALFVSLLYSSIACG